KKNRKFYGCEKYPDCDFVSWERPVSKRCPSCGSLMVIKPRKTGAMLLCTNETCRHSEPYEQPEESEDA
ncbi:MAG: hypothetical protein GX650_02920, partial [Clostridiales bacterium]|nr:hypothetical protein [Clostridiales bacterium]